MEILGVDIGATGIKGAIVDTLNGKMVTPRLRILTPQPSNPEHISETVLSLVDQIGWKGPAGAGFPAVVRAGVVYTAANIDPTWIGVDAGQLFSSCTGCRFSITNDADAAGIAEMMFGAGRGNEKGVVMVLTLGTGIGSALFSDGVLVPNLELGHLQIRGKDAERRASDGTRQQKDLSWKQWARRVSEYLSYLEALFWPDLFIIGGGGSKHFDKIAPFIHLRTKMIPAQYLNEAGIVGAALFAGMQESTASTAKDTSLG